MVEEKIWEQLSTVSTSISVPFFVLDKEWRIVYSNEEASSKYQYRIANLWRELLTIKDHIGDLLEFTFETKIPSLGNSNEQVDVYVFIWKLQFYDKYCVILKDKPSSLHQDGIDLAFVFRNIRREIDDFFNIQDSKIEKGSFEEHEGTDVFRIELLKKISLLDLMQQVATAANETKDLEALLQFTMDRVCVIAGWKLGRIELFAGAESRLVPNPIWYSGEEKAVKEFRSLVETLELELPLKVLKERKTIWFEDFLENFGYNSKELAYRAVINSALAVPIWNGENIVGVMEFFINSENSDPSLIAVLSHVASQIGRAFERKNAEANLRKSQEQLRALSARLQEVREEERILIAREIHDELGQILTVLKIEITLYKRNIVSPDSSDNKIIKDLDSMIHLVDTAIESTQRIATELRPLLLEELGLFEGIEWYGEEFQKRTGIVCTVTKTVLKSSLSKEIAIALFRIFQETLTNVARHSKATSVSVFIEEDDSFVALTISDNGIGIKEKELLDSKSLGIIGIRERAIVLGGTVEISGAQEKGTSVVVRIPILKSSFGSET
ncbi:histidine kinase [Leptospira tipperaryensis]|uniref:histidine kinase n=1 Tax=Leptospira tipperaryensis TaxID=2564040 RepID=A0A1D7V258_9LEPT|nr:histidine kinase [Leptospira tipperaryensis]